VLLPGFKTPTAYEYAACDKLALGFEFQDTSINDTCIQTITPIKFTDFCDSLGFKADSLVTLMPQFLGVTANSIAQLVVNKVSVKFDADRKFSAAAMQSSLPDVLLFDKLSIAGNVLLISTDGQFKWEGKLSVKGKDAVLPFNLGGSWKTPLASLLFQFSAPDMTLADLAGMFGWSDSIGTINLPGFEQLNSVRISGLGCQTTPKGAQFAWCQIKLRMPSLNFTAVKANDPTMSFNVTDPFGKLLSLKEATLQSLWELGPISQYKFSGPAVYSFADGLSLASNFTNVSTIVNPMGITGLRFKPLQANLRVWRANEKLNVKVLGRAEVRLRVRVPAREIICEGWVSGPS
jgi:hypothetical protein